MIRSIFIKLITIVVMAAHSLFGCSFHHACNMCCGEEVSECGANCSCESDCCENSTAACSQHQNLTSNCCLFSEVEGGISNHEKSPAKAPCHCKCEHSDCVFLHDTTVQSIVDGISQPPSTLFPVQILFPQKGCVSGDLRLELHSLSTTGASGCAISQVWLI